MSKLCTLRSIQMKKTMSLNKMMLFDFTCGTCKTTEEKMVSSTVHDYPCGYCLDRGTEGTMKRVISGTSFRLDGTDPAFPTAYAGWEKKRLSKQGE